MDESDGEMENDREKDEKCDCITRYTGNDSGRIYVTDIRHMGEMEQEDRE